MKKQIEIIVKCSSEEQLADALASISEQLLNNGFEGAPNDIREFGEDEGDGELFGFSYNVTENDGTDMYGNEIT